MDGQMLSRGDDMPASIEGYRASTFKLQGQATLHGTSL